MCDMGNPIYIISLPLSLYYPTHPYRLYIFSFNIPVYFTLSIFPTFSLSHHYFLLLYLHYPFSLPPLFSPPRDIFATSSLLTHPFPSIPCLSPHTQHHSRQSRTSMFPPQSTFPSAFPSLILLLLQPIRREIAFSCYLVSIRACLFDSKTTYAKSFV